MTGEALPFDPRDRAAYLPSADALVLADLHLGRLESAGVAVPVESDVVERVADLQAWCDPAVVVVAGDVLHSFSTVEPAAAEVLADLEALAAGRELRFVAGNHDAVLGDHRDAAEAVELDDGTVVCHGHEAPEEPAGTYVVGHDHPAIDVGGRRLPCYLYGEEAYRRRLLAAARRPAGVLARGVGRERRGDLRLPAALGVPRPPVTDGKGLVVGRSTTSRGDDDVRR